MGQLLNFTLWPINIPHWNVICQLWQQYSVTVNRYLKPLVHVSESPGRAGCSQLSKSTQGTRPRSCNSRDLFSHGKPKHISVMVWSKPLRATCCHQRGLRGAEFWVTWRDFALAREKMHLHGAGSQPCLAVLRWRGSLQSRCNFRSRRHLSNYYKLPLVKGRTGTLQLWFTPWRRPRQVRVMPGGSLSTD